MDSNSLNSLSLCAEAAWSDGASVINHAHWFVSWVAWELNLIVFNDVLLDDGLSGFLTHWLFDDLCVEVHLRNEAVVAWNMLGYLRRAYG